MRSLLPGILLLICQQAFCQALLPLPTSYQSITSGSCQQADAFAQLHQPAALTGIRHWSAGLYSSRRFMLSELTQAGVALAMPLGRQAAGIAFQYMGGPLLRQSEAVLGVARQLGRDGALGLQFYYRNHQVSGYGQQGSLGYALGARLRLTEQVQALVSVANPQALDRTGYTSHAARYEVGIGADLSEAIYLGCSLVKMTGRAAGLQAGMQYRIQKSLYCRMGISTGTHEFVLGAGYLLGAFRLDVFTTLHSQLGLSPGLQLLYQPPGK